jgi:hypothetical protein
MNQPANDEPMDEPADEPMDEPMDDTTDLGIPPKPEVWQLDTEGTVGEEYTFGCVQSDVVYYKWYHHGIWHLKTTDDTVDLSWLSPLPHTKYVKVKTSYTGELGSWSEASDPASIYITLF